MAQHKYVVTIYTGTPCLTRQIKSNYMHQLQTEQCWWALVHSLRQISITRPLKTNHASQQEVPPAHPEGEQTKYNLSSNGSMGCYVDVLILQRQILFSETESQQPTNVAHPCHTAPMLFHTSNALLKWWRKRNRKYRWIYFSSNGFRNTPFWVLHWTVASPLLSLLVKSK